MTIYKRRIILRLGSEGSSVDELADFIRRRSQPVRGILASAGIEAPPALPCGCVVPSGLEIDKQALAADYQKHRSVQVRVDKHGIRRHHTRALLTETGVTIPRRWRYVPRN